MQYKLTLPHALYDIDLSIDIIWEMWGNEQREKRKTHRVTYTTYGTHKHTQAATKQH